MREFKAYLVGVTLMIGLVVLSSSCERIIKEKTLYDRLGGKDAITAVVDDFVARVAADSRINGFFANADIPRLKQCLVDQICQAADGPCEYKCRDMKSSHAGLGISTADFNALVEDLVKTLDKYKVGTKEKEELISILGPLKGDIVEKP